MKNIDSSTDEITLTPKYIHTNDLREDIIYPTAIQQNSFITKSIIDIDYEMSGYYSQQKQQVPLLSLNENTSIISAIINVENCYSITFNQELFITNGLYNNYFIFTDNELTPVIQYTDISKYVELINEENLTYKLTLPENTQKVITAFHKSFINDFTNSLFGDFSVNDIQFSWLKINLNNFTNDVIDYISKSDIITPDKISTDEYKQSETLTDIAQLFSQYYKHENDKLVLYDMSSLVSLTYVVNEYDTLKIQYHTTIGKSLYTSYFIFTDEDMNPVLMSTSVANYIEVVDSESYIYKITIPKNTTRFTTTTQKSIYNAGNFKCNRITDYIITPPWLKLNSNNIGQDVYDSLQSNITLDSSYIYSLFDDYMYSQKQFHLYDSIKKPITFSGKTLIAYGDSITYGVASPGLTYSNTQSYIVKFCEYVGATLINKARSGTTIADSSRYSSDTGSIRNVIKRDTTQGDIIFIAGGTNDFGTGLPVGSYTDTDTSTVYGALRDLCEWLKENRSDCTIIFLTPIPRTKPEMSIKDVTTPLNYYRSAIYDIATEYEFNVVDGNSIGMPQTKGDWNNFMCTDSDGCHPTVEGHKLIARNLCGKLL